VTLLAIEGKKILIDPGVNWWEKDIHDMHLYHRQAMGGDLAFGNSDFQRKKVARELGL